MEKIMEKRTMTIKELESDLKEHASMQGQLSAEENLENANTLIEIMKNMIDKQTKRIKTLETVIDQQKMEREQLFNRGGYG